MADCAVRLHVLMEHPLLQPLCGRFRGVLLGDGAAGRERGCGRSWRQRGCDPHRGLLGGVLLRGFIGGVLDNVSKIVIFRPFGRGRWFWSWCSHEWRHAVVPHDGRLRPEGG